MITSTILITWLIFFEEHHHRPLGLRLTHPRPRQGVGGAAAKHTLNTIVIVVIFVIVFQQYSITSKCSQTPKARHGWCCQTYFEMPPTIWLLLLLITSITSLLLLFVTKTSKFFFFSTLWTDFAKRWQQLMRSYVCNGMTSRRMFVQPLETWDRTTSSPMWPWPVRMVSRWRLTRWFLWPRVHFS